MASKIYLFVFLGFFSCCFSSEFATKRVEKKWHETLLDLYCTITKKDKQEILLKNRLKEKTPSWMDEQITSDFAYFQNTPISRKKIVEQFERQEPHSYLVKFTISQNRVYREINWSENEFIEQRIRRYESVLNALCRQRPLPDMIFLLCLHDSISFEKFEDLPIFGMCKMIGRKIILVPDFEAVKGRYQVFTNKDITRLEPIWGLKKDQLIWRGSTAQFVNKEAFTEENLPHFSRVTLCKLSQQFPHLMDAKFTIFAQGGEHIPSLQAYNGKRISFEKEAMYKYHILIDGNASPYSCSGWKFFINSLIFKPESIWVQWYTQALQPNIHFIPVKANLEDLIEKISWAKENDDKAQEIAQNARNFALTHLTVLDNLHYLYQCLIRYSELGFVD